MNIKFLDGLRGIAALYVMIGHARWLLWEGYSEGFIKHSSAYSATEKAAMYFFSLFKYGHEAVLLFFVMSGFVIHNGFVRKIQKDSQQKINFGQFYLKRVRRIYPPFMFALVLTAVLDNLGSHFGFSIYMGQTLNGGINTTVGNSSHSLSIFLGNILFVFHQYVPVFGTNGPTWSLKLEWWFYVVYPIFLIFARKNIGVPTILVLMLFFVSNYTIFWKETLSMEVFGGLTCWWMGVVLAEVFARRIKIDISIFAILALLGVMGLNSFGIDENFYDLKVSLFFTAIMAGLLSLKSKNFNLGFIEIFKPFGDFSYTLYIIHFPILVFISGTILKYSNNKLPQHSYFIVLGIVVTIVVAYLSHFFVELPFIKAKKQEQTSSEETTFVEYEDNSNS